MGTGFSRGKMYVMSLEQGCCFIIVPMKGRVCNWKSYVVVEYTLLGGTNASYTALSSIGKYYKAKYKGFKFFRLNELQLLSLLILL